MLVFVTGVLLVQIDKRIVMHSRNFNYQF